MNKPPSTTLANIGALRTSCRSFDGEALSLDAVKGLLTLAYSNLVRSTPSAGGLYSCRLDIICVDEGSDVWGLHSWDPRNAEIGNQLKLIDSGELQHALESVSLLFGASALIVISVDPQIHSAKYSNRGYRYSLLEAGHVAQMINLAATEQGLGVLEWGAFNDRVLAECMDLTEHHPLVVVGLGNPIEVAKGPKEPDRQSLAEVNFSYYGVPDDHAGRSSGVAIAQIPFAFDGSLSPSGYASGIHWTRSLAGVKARSELMERQACQGFRVDVVGSAKALADRYYIYEVEEAFPSIMPAFLEESDEFAPFDSSNTEMQWRIAQSQQHGEVLVPVELVYFPVFSSQIGRRLCGSATSSGVAAHQTLEQAKRAALHELIERDAFVRHWISQEPPTRICQPKGIFDKKIASIKDYGMRVIFSQLKAAIPVISCGIIAPDNSILAFGLAAGESVKSVVEKSFLDAYGTLVMSKNAQIEVDSCQGAHLSHYLAYRNSGSGSPVMWFFEGQKGSLKPEVDCFLMNKVESLTCYVSLGTSSEAAVSIIRALNPSLRSIWFGGRWRPADDPNDMPHFFS